MVGNMAKATSWQEPQLSELEQKLLAIIEPVVRSEGLFLLEIELAGDGSGRTLRIYVDGAQGVSLDDCVNISRQVGDILDVEDTIPQRYRLEVSSPGLDRKLKYAREFEIFAGRKARLLIHGQEKNYYVVGTLKGLVEEDIIVQVEDTIIHFPLSNIIRAQLQVEF